MNTPEVSRSSNPVQILVCTETEVSKLTSSTNSVNVICPYSSATGSFRSSVKTDDDEKQPNYVLFNSVSFWASSNAEKEKEKEGSDGGIDIDSTLMHHVCLQPYLNVSCDVGQEKLFVSPTDAQLALKLALHEQKLDSKQPLSALPNKAVKIVTSSAFADSCENSNSILTVELNKFGLTSDSTFLEKLLFGGLCQEDVEAFEQFLDINNKYDLANALSSFIDYLSSNKDNIHALVLQVPDSINQSAETEANLMSCIHPLEVVILRRMQEKFPILEGTEKTEMVLDNLNGSPTFYQLPEVSKSELTLFSSWTSYLTLLVNSRCELSLARTLNVPDRELEPSVFKALKRTAKEKDMPMFQTALSHITQVRLGGKGYRPSSKSLLVQHVKGLGDYVDFVDRLRAHLEDYNLSPKVAIKRVLLSLQREFLACKKSTEFRPYIDSVYEQFFSLLKDTCAAGSQIASSPKTPNSGGSLAGREAFRVLHKLITKLNLIHSIRSVNTLNFASNMSKLNHTPVLDAFHSPAAEVEKMENFTAIMDENAVDFPDVDEKPKKEAIKTPDNRGLKKSRKSQEMNWAKTPETPFFRVSDLCVDELSNGILDFQGKDGKENVESSQTENDLEKTITMDDAASFEETLLKPISPEIGKKCEKIENISEAVPKKRKVEKILEAKNEPISKKSTTHKPKDPTKPHAKSKTGHASKDSKSKQAPLKGQKSLTSFFK